MTDPAGGASLAELDDLLELVAEGVAERMTAHDAEAGPRFERAAAETESWGAQPSPPEQSDG